MATWPPEGVRCQLQSPPTVFPVIAQFPVITHEDWATTGVVGFSDRLVNHKILPKRQLIRIAESLLESRWRTEVHRASSEVHGSGAMCRIVHTSAQRRHQPRPWCANCFSVCEPKSVAATAISEGADDK